MNKKPTSFEHTFSDADLRDDLAYALSLRSTRPVSVQAVLFLQTRPMTKEHGGLSLKIFCSSLIFANNYIHMYMYL